jgi:actin-related protein
LKNERGMASETPKTIVSGRTRPSATAASSSAQLASPHTPLSRSISASIYGSPSAFRVDDENLLIFQIGSRNIRVGFAGESSPRCVQSYGPDQLRRVGDYRQYAPGYDPRNQNKKNDKDWAEDYELWKPDVRDQDLNLLGDRLERLIREIESTQLMLDTRTRKVALVLSSQLPRPLLEITIASIFNTIQCPTMTVLPSNIMSVVGAGLRSALVIDIGWSETNISAIFEYRQVSQKSTVQAAKLLVKEYADLIGNDITVEEAEDVLVRQGWCRSRNANDDEDEEVHLSNIQLGYTSVGVTFQDLAKPIDQVFFGSDTKPGELDDDSLPIPTLAYLTLHQLPIDVRRVCISRLVVTGGASAIPGLKRRILEDLNHLIEHRHWDPIRAYGSFDPRRKGDALSEIAVPKIPSPEEVKRTEKITNASEDSDDESHLPAHLVEPEPDRILEKIRQQQRPKNETDSQEPVARIINTLGPWVGASLTTSLRIRGVVEIEKDRFMSAGLVGGAFKKETSAATQRQSMGPGARTNLEKSHWSLGVWA